MIASRLSVVLLVAALLFARQDVNADAPVTLQVDKENSHIVAHVKATGHRFEAVVTDFELDLFWDPESGRISGARLVFDFEDVETGRSRRDREMLEWLDHDTYPEATFILNTIEEVDGETVASGTFSLYRTERDIEFPVTLEERDGVLHVRAETILDHRDWELETIRAMLFMTVDPELEIKIDIRAALP